MKDFLNFVVGRGFLVKEILLKEVLLFVKFLLVLGLFDGYYVWYLGCGGYVSIFFGILGCWVDCWLFLYEYRCVRKLKLVFDVVEYIVLRMEFV